MEEPSGSFQGVRRVLSNYRRALTGLRFTLLDTVKAVVLTCIIPFGVLLFGCFDMFHITETFYETALPEQLLILRQPGITLKLVAELVRGE